MTFDFLFPKNGSVLDPRTDLSLGRNILVRTTTTHFRIGRDGGVKFVLSAQGLNATEAFDQWYAGYGGYPNFELFGLTEGKYYLMASLTDNNGDTRDCWKVWRIRFWIREGGSDDKAKPASPAKLLMRSLRHSVSSGAIIPARRPWLMQPERHDSYAYVTVLWSNEFVDCAISWAMGLIDTGSSFRRVCLVAKDRMDIGLLTVLERCCCEILPTDPIRSPEAATRGEWSRYEFALTKLRVLQLHRYGLRKIVLMDADTMVLQNLDELFWFPAPAAAVTKGALLGETEAPELSSGVMVLEPSDAEFNGVFRYLREWERKAGPKDQLRFIEQQLLSLYWLEGGRQRYHVLPMGYNLYPELLDVFPFLRSKGEAADLPKGVGPNSVKVVHFWDWYNPVLAFQHRDTEGNGPGARYLLQIQARTKHSVMWRWYERWWDLHRRGLSLVIPEGYESWRRICLENVERGLPRLDPEQAENYRPMLGSGEKLACFHMHGIYW